MSETIVVGAHSIVLLLIRVWIHVEEMEEHSNSMWNTQINVVVFSNGEVDAQSPKSFNEWKS